MAIIMAVDGALVLLMRRGNRFFYELCSGKKETQSFDLFRTVLKMKA